LAPNTRYVITIQPLEQPVEQNAWDVLEPMTGTVGRERLDLGTTIIWGAVATDNAANR